MKRRKTNLTNLTKWSHKKWTNPWWATNHKSKINFIRWLRKTKSIRLDSKTSLLVDSMLIFINNIIMNKPTNSMWPISLLLWLKLYSNRHPITSNSNKKKPISMSPNINNNRNNINKKNKVKKNKKKINNNTSRIKKISN